MVLKSYLDTYKDADEAHRDSITAHLNMLQQVDQDWTNALVSDSKEALEAYLQKYPNTPHKNEIWNKIDSIDWQLARETTRWMLIRHTWMHMPTVLISKRLRLP